MNGTVRTIHTILLYTDVVFNSLLNVYLCCQSFEDLAEDGDSTTPTNEFDLNDDSKVSFHRLQNLTKI